MVLHCGQLLADQICFVQTKLTFQWVVILRHSQCLSQCVLGNSTKSTECCVVTPHCVLWLFRMNIDKDYCEDYHGKFTLWKEMYDIFICTTASSRAVSAEIKTLVKIGLGVYLTNLLIRHSAKWPSALCPSTSSTPSYSHRVENILCRPLPDWLMASYFSAQSFPSETSSIMENNVLWQYEKNSKSQCWGWNKSLRVQILGACISGVNTLLVAATHKVVV